MDEVEEQRKDHLRIRLRFQFRASVILVASVLGSRPGTALQPIGSETVKRACNFRTGVTSRDHHSGVRARDFCM